MHRTLFLLLTLAGIQHSIAQIPAGAKMLSGYFNLSGNSQKDADAALDESRSFAISVSPRYGKFYKDNAALGGGITLAYYNQYDAKRSVFGSGYQTQTMKRNNFSFGGLYFMKFYKTLTDKVYLNLETRLDASYSLNYTHSLTTYTTGNSDVISDNQYGTIHSQISATPGFTWFLTDRLAFDLSFGSLFYRNLIQFENTFSDVNQVSHSYGLSLRSSTVYAGLTLFL